MRNPPVQVLGDAVVLQRGAVVAVAVLVARGLTYARNSGGRTPSPEEYELSALLTTVATRVNSSLVTEGQSVVQPAPPVPVSDRINASEAAALMHLSTRSVVRLAPSLGGWGGRRGRAWSFSRAQVLEYLDNQEN